MTVAMRIQIDFSAGKPVYLQVVDQVKAAVASGALRAGDTLPGIRPLAESVRVNRNTIAKAYGELENQGVIQAAAGRGCIVRDAGTPYRKDARLDLLKHEIDAAVVQSHHLQINRSDFLRLAEARFDAFAQQRAAATRE
jgi:GntR family transcriptional regulator